MFYRKLVTMLYLNSVNEGGETEFYQTTHQAATRSTRHLPGGLYHTHRGNPPPAEISTSTLGGGI